MGKTIITNFTAKTNVLKNLPKGPCGDPIIYGEVKLFGQRNVPYFVFMCPWCGRKHYHGASVDMVFPFHEVSHCKRFDGCYYLEVKPQ